MRLSHTLLLRTLVMLSFLGFAGPAAVAKPWWMRGIDSNETDFLPPDVAFRAGARIDGSALRVRWVIADGYYLYRQKISVAAESPGLVVSGISLPPGAVKTDPYLGTQEIYTQQVEGTVTYRRLDYGAHPLQIKVTYQGCAESALTGGPRPARRGDLAALGALRDHRGRLRLPPGRLGVAQGSQSPVAGRMIGRGT
jgi:thioredoxin:protein disulfide reductase